MNLTIDVISFEMEIRINLLEEHLLTLDKDNIEDINRTKGRIQELKNMGSWIEIRKKGWD